MLLPALPAGCAPRCSSCCTCRASGRACWWRSSRRAAPCRCARRRTRSRSSAGTVYFAPPDYHLLVDAATAAVAPLGRRARALLAALDRRAVRIGRGRLSASGCWASSSPARNDDGAAGLAAVQRAGGITVVQQPDTAQAPLMPASALQRVARRTTCCRSTASPSLLRSARPRSARRTRHRRHEPRAMRTDGQVPARRRPRGEPLALAALLRRDDVEVLHGALRRRGARAAAGARRGARAARRADAGDGRLRAGRADARQRAHAPRADHLRHRRRARSAPHVQGLRARRGRLPLQADRAARSCSNKASVFFQLDRQKQQLARELRRAHRDAAPQRDVHRRARPRPAQPAERDRGRCAAACSASRRTRWSTRRQAAC